MDSMRKLHLAKCLSNVNEYINEAFNNSTGTQRSDMGAWKRFCINLTNVALPNTIAEDLVLVAPLDSFTGYVTYR